MRPVTIVYVTDMDAAVDFYRKLLPQSTIATASPYWTELALQDASIALHVTEAVTAGSQVGLALTADQPLEHIASQLGTQGISVDRGIADEAFGRSMVIADPDGLKIQINEHADNG